MNREAQAIDDLPPSGPLATMTQSQPDVQRGRAEAPLPRRRSPLSRIRLPVGVLGVFVGCMLAWRDALRSGVFDDTFWHRAAGVWMLDHHHVMRHDVFSYTVTGHTWITPEWGYDVVLAEGLRIFGSGWFWFLSAGLATLTVLAVALRTRLLGSGWIWTGLLCLETGAAVTLFLDDRPQMVSYFFFSLLLLLLTTARRKRGVLWALPLLFFLWANLHGSFLLGLLVLALEAVASLVPFKLGRVEVIDPLPRSAALYVLGGSAVATFVNPFGPNVYSSALGVTFNSTVRSLIAEWQSPDFHDPTTLAVVVLPLVFALGYLAFSKRALSAVELVLAAFLLVSTLDASRFLPYFAIASCALLARCTPIENEQLKPTVLTWPLIAVLGISLVSGPRLSPGEISGSVPVGAVNYLAVHEGRVFSTYLWNDYLDWRGIPVFVDGRTELYTDNGILRDYLEVDNLTKAPDSLLRRYGVKYVLWPHDQALSVYLEHDPSWRVVRSSQLSFIFQYVGAGGGGAARGGGPVGGVG
jgi:hypothetical protein